MLHNELRRQTRINRNKKEKLKGKKKEKKKERKKERKKQTNKQTNKQTSKQTQKLRSNLINFSKAASGTKQLLALHDIKYIFCFCLLGAIFSGVKRLGREAHYSPPSSAEVKIGEVVLSLPNMSTWHGV
jgi:hypothetical protein